MKRYTVAVDFDGVLHGYKTPWTNARTIPDPPVPGAMEWLMEITRKFDVVILSTRNHQFLGKWAMKRWLRKNLWHPAYARLLESDLLGRAPLADAEVEAFIACVMHHISFPKTKPPALVYIDDRAWRFEGDNFPTAEQVYKAHPWMHKATKVLAVLVLLLAPLGVRAQEAQPTPQALCNPAAQPCLTTESLALALRAWSPGVDEPRDLAGGAVQAELRYRNLRFQGQAIGTATSGYKQGDLSTVRDVEAHLAFGYDLLRLRGGIAVGPMLAIGGAVALPEGGASASLARSYTLLIGLQAAFPGGRIHLGLGSAHPLDRGLAVAAKWQIPISAGGRVYSMGYVAMGRRNVPAALDGSAPAHSAAAISAWTAVGVRL